MVVDGCQSALLLNFYLVHLDCVVDGKWWWSPAACLLFPFYNMWAPLGIVPDHPVQSPNYANNKFWNILHSPNDDMHRYSTSSSHSPKLQYIFYKYSVAHTGECKDPCPTSISKHKTTEQLKCRRLTSFLYSQGEWRILLWLMSLSDRGCGCWSR